MLERVKLSILMLKKIEDISPSMKIKIMELFETPEWEHYQELLELLEVRSQSQQKIINLINQVGIAKPVVLLP